LTTERVANQHGSLNSKGVEKIDQELLEKLRRILNGGFGTITETWKIRRVDPMCSCQGREYPRPIKSTGSISM
jgi:hypothetical protein